MCCLAKGECELLILALPPKCWGYRSVLPQQSWVVFKHVPLYLHEIVCLLFVLFIVCVHGMYKSENNFAGLVFSCFTWVLVVGTHQPCPYTS